MKTAFALLIALLACTSAFSQDRPTVAAQPNSVFVGADGKFEANPDTALIQFNISAQEYEIPSSGQEGHMPSPPGQSQGWQGMRCRLGRGQ